MGRWDDRPDDSSDDWRGWKKGKYDSRYRGVKNRGQNYRTSRNKTKSVVGVVTCLIIVVFGFVLWSQGFLDAAIENMPPNLSKEIEPEITPETPTQTTESSADISKNLESERTALEIKNVKQNLPENVQQRIYWIELDRSERGLPPLTLEEIKQIQDSEIRKEQERKEKDIQKEQQKAEQNKPSLSLDELKQIALDDINKYRTERGLNPLTLGSAKSPQLYAEELAKEGCIHHISVRGEGPMLRYKNNGDKMYLVSENISVTGGFWGSIPENEILGQNYNMMFDDADSGWGHRDNILDPLPKSVSIGLSYHNDYIFVMVQDFESVLSSGYEYDPSSFQIENMDEKKCVTNPSG